MTTKLRVLTWNLNVMSRHLEIKRQLLGNFDWDVIALQEARPEDIAELKLHLHGDCVFRRDDERRAERDYGSALFVSDRHAVKAHGLVEQAPWRERAVWADITLAGGAAVRVISFHSPNGTGQGGQQKMDHYEAVHNFVAAHDGPQVLAMDANSSWDCWPAEDEEVWAKRANNAKEGIWRWDRLLLAPDALKAPEERHGLRDAWRDVLEADRDRTERLRARRPYGPTGVTIANTMYGRVGPHRYDLIYVTDHFGVDDVTHHFDDAVAARSNHALVEAQLTLTAF